MLCAEFSCLPDFCVERGWDSCGLNLAPNDFRMSASAAFQNDPTLPPNSRSAWRGERFRARGRRERGRLAVFLS